MKAVWRALRPLARRRPSLLALAGPVALVAVIADWVALLGVGFALLYWTRLPGRFLLARGSTLGSRPASSTPSNSR